MTVVGIDRFAIYTPQYVLKLADLAKARGVDPDKYVIGLGQIMMSVPPPGEDIVTMAASAAAKVLEGIDVNKLGAVYLATESGIDQSKAAGLYVQELLQLPRRLRIVEFKEACYSATAALQMSMPYLRENPDKIVLLIATDIARYGLNTTGESSQGAGAIAIVLSAKPRLLAIEKEYGVVSESIMDFWRPNYSDFAYVEGKYSSRVYLQMLQETWQEYSRVSGRHFEDHTAFCYHVPIPRLVEKAQQTLAKLCGKDAGGDYLQDGLRYGRLVGNCYTASLYIALASLLENSRNDMSGQRIGFYSYGSGCVAEFFSGMVQPDYQQFLPASYHQALMANRTVLTYEEYEELYNFKYVEDGSEQLIPTYKTGPFRLARMAEHQRIYERVL